MADITGRITKIRTSDNSEHYINAKYWDGHEWGELASALKYCGITTTKLTDGATTNPVVIDDVNHTATAGCVVFYEDTENGISTTKEFVFNGNKWELLGGDSTYKVVQSTVSSPNANGSALAFIDTISQDANGVITVTKKYCKNQYRLEYTATASLGDLTPCNINSVLHEYDTSTGKGVFVYDEVPTVFNGFGSSGSTLTSVIIPDGVTSIGSRAFYRCGSLSSVTIPNSVTDIGDYAFGGCNSLTSITIPNSVTTIGDQALSNCSSLTSITIPDSITTIGGSAFVGCTSLKSITIPDSITSIGSYAFNGCAAMKSITIPDSVTTIGDQAFNGCTGELIINSKIVENNYTTSNYPSNYGWLIGSNFTKITIGDSVTSIGDYAFYNCTSMKSITIPDSVTSIGSYTFAGCTSLKIVTIPNSVTLIKDNIFAGCTSLTSITIPDSITVIAPRLFNGCSSLKNVDIPDSVTEIGVQAFTGCTSLKSIIIPDSVTAIGDTAFAGCNSMTSVIIGNGVTYIGNQAFAGCALLTSITIGSGVTSIGDQAFISCSNLETIYCKATIPPTMSARSGLIDLGRTIYVPMESVDTYKDIKYWGDYDEAIIGCVFEDENLVSGENIKTINSRSILGEGNINLNSINFPSDDELWYTSSMGMTDIPDNAFGTSNQIVSHTYENGIGVIRFKETLTEINARALEGNPDIESVYIPEKVTSIGQNAFNIETLTDVFMGSKTAPELYDANVFGNYETVSGVGGSLKIWIPVGDDGSYMGEVWHYYMSSFNQYIKGGENLISGKNIATINGSTIIGSHDFNLVEKSSDGYVTENLIPNYTTLKLGDSTKPWNTVYATNISGENGSDIIIRGHNGVTITDDGNLGDITLSSYTGVNIVTGDAGGSQGKINITPGVVTVEGHFYCSDYFEVNTNGICYAAAFYETSDENLKDFSDDITVDFNKLKEIRKSYFTWKDGEQKLHIGTSAQDVQKVYPELVSENSEGNLTVDYAKLSIIALSAIDKLDERLSRIEKILNKEE